MQKIISEILKAEEEAVKITDSAEEKRRNVASDIKAKADEIRAGKMAQAELEIKAKAEAFEKKLNENTAKANSEFEEEIKKLELCFTQNRKEWADTAFKNIISK